jgi:intracellular multiplication protein IcmV
MARENKRGFFKRHFNVSEWMGINDVFYRMKQLPSMFHGLTTVKKTLHKETFEEAIVRLELTKADIEEKKKSFFYAAITFFVFGVLSFAYASTFIVTGKWQGFVLATMVALILFAHAFQTHFWYTQMRKRRLGLSIREWLCAFFGY